MRSVNILLVSVVCLITLLIGQTAVNAKLTFEERQKVLIDKASTTNPLAQVLRMSKYLPQDQLTIVLNYASGPDADLISDTVYLYLMGDLADNEWQSFLNKKEIPKIVHQNKIDRENKQKIAAQELEEKRKAELKKSEEMQRNKKIVYAVSAFALSFALILALIKTKFPPYIISVALNTLIAVGFSAGRFFDLDLHLDFWSSIICIGILGAQFVLNLIVWLICGVTAFILPPWYEGALWSLSIFWLIILISDFVNIYNRIWYKYQKWNNRTIA